MQKLKLILFLFITIGTLSLTSCKDDDDDDVSPNVSLLTNGVWTIDAILVNGQDITIDIEEENQIDLSLYTSKFERDGSYVDRYDGEVLVDGTWEYANNERLIVFDKGTSDEYEVVISKLDEDELFYLQDGVEYRFVR